MVRTACDRAEFEWQGTIVSGKAEAWQLVHAGRGRAAGWAPVGPQLRLPHIKFIYPTAPTRPITVNMGMRMPG